MSGQLSKKKNSVQLGKRRTATTDHLRGVAVHRVRSEIFAPHRIWWRPLQHPAESTPTLSTKKKKEKNRKLGTSRPFALQLRRRTRFMRSHHFNCTRVRQIHRRLPVFFCFGFIFFFLLVLFFFFFCHRLPFCSPLEVGRSTFRPLKRFVVFGSFFFYFSC